MSNIPVACGKVAFTIGFRQPSLPMDAIAFTSNTPMLIMKDFLLRLLTDEDGPTAVEYAVMVAMVVLVCIGSIMLVGSKTGASFTDSATKMP